MHSTRRLLDRYWSSALVLTGCLAAGAAGASCSSSSDDAHDAPAIDTADAAGPDAQDLHDGEATDATTSPDSADAAPFESAPRSVECASLPCATSLVTTLGAGATDLGEGFCALLDDGAVACWGAGGAGQLGRGEDAGLVDSPSAARVVGLANIVSLDHTCALDKDGAIFCWGTGPFLRDPGVATTTERTPVKLDIPPATKVALGPSVGCALASGGLLCWGSNTYGQLGPVEEIPSSSARDPQTVVLPSGAAVKELVLGNAAFAVRADKTSVSWGANPPLARISSLSLDPYPLPTTLGRIDTIDVAYDNACATASGVGYCWGVQEGRTLPTPVQAPEPLVSIATTRTLTDLTPPRTQRWCAVGVSGAVYCWGYNAGGQAGDGTKDHAYEAVQVVGLPAPASQVKTTPDATCALLTSGKVYCWGTNLYGQLGNGLLKDPSPVPQEVVIP